jgi:cytochrome P450
VALEPIEVEGTQLDREIVLALLLGSANHDPRRYDRPDELDVTRADPKPLSFGGGAHYCVGAALARLEAKHAFASLLASTRTIELATDRVTWKASVGLRGLDALPVTLR